jgi:putative peptidoglycan lipid II flippase
MCPRFWSAPHAVETAAHARQHLKQHRPRTARSRPFGCTAVSHIGIALVASDTELGIMRGPLQHTATALLGPAATVAIVTAIVYALLLARDLLFAAYLGRTAQLDEFLIALIIPNYMISAIGGSLSTAIVPFYVVASQQSDAARQSYVVRAIRLTLFYSLALTALVELLYAATGEGLKAIGLASNLSGWLLGLIALGVIANLLTAIGYVDRRLILSAGGAGIVPVVVAGVMLALGKACTVRVVAFATLAGTVLQCLLLFAPQYRMLRKERRGTGSWHSGMEAGFASTFFPLLFASVIMSTLTAVDQVFASSFGGGAVATVSFAGKVVLTFAGLFTVVASAVALPAFSHHAASGNWAAHRHQVSRLAAYAFIGFSAVALVVYGSSYPLTRVLFQRGQFMPADTLAVADLQRWYSLHLPFYAAGLILSRAHASLRDTKTLLLGAVLAVVAKIAGVLTLAPYFGLNAIGVSTAISYAACLAFLLATYCVSVKSKLRSQAPLLGGN